ncbi:MAG TPA: CDP-alcohol phosphatidyltransferase family protein [Candidatus Tetragenococcus pullicola]|nr:CDP-alcohol phosphatidyltransferase family protein [Candidatus Tetragenococcus pullicola]
MYFENWKEEWKSIPNLLSIFRLLLVPIYLYLTLGADNKQDIYWAAGILIVSGLTDFADGQIARRFDQITNLGKFLDPVADKITQLALLISVAYHNSSIIWLVVLFVIKELFMLVAGAIGLKKKVYLQGAQWFGKVSTAIIYITIPILLIFPQIPEGFKQALFYLIGFYLALSFILYIREYWKMFNKSKND